MRPCLPALWRRFLVCMVLACSVCGPVLADDYLPPEQAFVLTTSVVDARTVRLHWDIAPGYHLYRDRIAATASAVGFSLASARLPGAKEVFDSNFNRQVAVYDKAVDVDLVFAKGPPGFALSVGWQGCADAGLCYPPETRELNVALQAFGASRDLVGSAEQAASPAPTDTAVVAAPAADSQPDAIARTLAGGSLLQTLGVFWVAGLLLSFTPCVLPMLPILSSLIAGQSGSVGRGKGLGLSAAYTLGMALVYAGFGVAAGLAGEGLAAALQNPWVLGGFALLLSGLALSMFGVYELQLPGGLQSRAADLSNRFKGGSFIGVFCMGGVSALVVGPCVAAPLAGALVYISRTHDVVLGGMALFAMAWGMGVPLLLVGVSAGSLLPRAGAWMERVKQVFGMMLLGVAIWMVSPVLPPAAHLLLWAAWLWGGAALAGLFTAATAARPQPGLARAGGAALAACALVLLVGAASGGQSVLQPLAHLRGGTVAAGAGVAPAGLRFQRVASVQALEAALTQAQQKGEAVMLDFYADWCVACKELESFTFSDPQVQKRLAPVRLLQADVTDNNAEHKALLKRFGLFGPPGMVFFDAAKTAEATHTVVGYQNAQTFLASLDKALRP